MEDDQFRALLAGEKGMAAVRQKMWVDQVAENREWEEAIHREDAQSNQHILSRERWLRVEQYRRPRRGELLRFTEAQKKSGEWKAALKDPEAAAAMRALRRRVAALNDFGAPPPIAPASTQEWSYRMLNNHQGRCGRPPPERYQQVRTSVENPLAYNEHCKGWNPNAIKWPGRTIPFEPYSSTSLWYKSWGENAGDGAIDFNFNFVDLPYRESKSTAAKGKKPA
ncbi:hypothetical protein AB1Y20_021926 [Prymnesium parvum]|uniref:Uncharacterized protein n=1 Tax=Prymnesium parvum TaxID=97485 RepID=A0AB34JHZ8_PRYPA